MQDWPNASEHVSEREQRTQDGLHEQRSPNGLTVRLPLGVATVEARGLGVLLVLVIALLAALIVLILLHDHGRQQDTAQTREQLRLVLEAHQEVAYMLTLTQEQREALRLHMPESLRRRLR